MKEGRVDVNGKLRGEPNTEEVLDDTTVKLRCLTVLQGTRRTSFRSNSSCFAVDFGVVSNDYALTSEQIKAVCAWFFTLANKAKSGDAPSWFVNQC